MLIYVLSKKIKYDKIIMRGEKLWKIKENGWFWLLLFL